MKRHSIPILAPTQNLLQRGFTKGVSPIFSALIVQEVIDNYKDTNQSVCVAYLDAKAAFDNVNKNNHY